MTAISGESWLELQPASTPQGIVHINEYFVRNPERILGTLALTENGQYRKYEAAVLGTLTGELLAKAAEGLPSGVFLPRNAAPTIANCEPIDWTGVKDGALFEWEGRLFRRMGAGSEAVSASSSAASRIRGLLQVRAAVAEAFCT